MAVAEAAARALPVVATCVGFPGEMVQEGLTGFVVPPADENALAEAIGRVLALSPQEQRAMGWQMKNRVEDLGVTEPAWAVNFMRIFNQLLSRCGVASGQPGDRP
jgi:glycosyltransferase involved in cell wall biosynthesis